jgi:LL-diaminopimelate aminotransferase
MTGWRLGFVCGNPRLVSAYNNVKDNSDSGQFLAIQKACAATLAHPEITAKIAAKYSRRMDSLVACLRRLGFDATKPKASFFLYVRAPKAVADGEGNRTAFQSAEDVSQWLITQKLISTVPWDEAGPYLRFSVTFVAKGEADERRVVGEIDKRLAGLKFEF